LLDIEMKWRWKLAVGIFLALCGAGAALVGGRYIYKLINRHRLVQAASLARVRAEKDDAKAQLELATMFYYGTGVPQNYAESARWYRKAADQGDVKAKVAIAFMSYYGKGVSQDYTEAARWYRSAAEQGDAKAEFYLASMYYDGKGVQQDYSEAVRWYRRAAEQGDAAAQVGLGYMYQEGKGVQQDFNEAIGWYRKAAYRGDAEAAYNLGYMYYNGQGLPQDYSAAVRWYRESAEHGNPDARRALQSIERKSTIATRIRYFVFLVSLVGGLILSLGFLLPGRSFRNSRHATVLGVVALCYAGLSFYGITHDDMRYSSCRSLFYLAQGVLIGISVVIGTKVIVTKQKKTDAG
jgi:TPR repeat protein